MRKFAPIVIALLLFGSSRRVLSQDRVEAGVFLDCLGISQTNTSNFGVGGRFGYRIHRKVMIEGEVAYDYGINFHEAYRNISNGDVTAIERTSIGVTHGLFGPTVKPAKGRFRPFVTLKGGFMDFRLSPSLLPLSTVESTLLGIRTSSFNAAMYPGAGMEASLGPVGLRFELGDEIYFNDGAQQSSDHVWSNPQVLSFSPDNPVSALAPALRSVRREIAKAKLKLPQKYCTQVAVSRLTRI